MSGSLFINLRRSLRKAFDTLPHQSLLRKLESYRVKDINLAWFSDYLSNRNQVVCVDGTYSDPQPVLTGVPQGSILSLLLFIFYINDLPCCLQFSQILMYDDVTVIYFSGNSISEI